MFGWLVGWMGNSLEAVVITLKSDLLPFRSSKPSDTLLQAQYQSTIPRGTEQQRSSSAILAQKPVQAVLELHLQKGILECNYKSLFWYSVQAVSTWQPCSCQKSPWVDSAQHVQTGWDYIKLVVFPLLVFCFKYTLIVPNYLRYLKQIVNPTCSLPDRFLAI